MCQCCSFTCVPPASTPPTRACHTGHSCFFYLAPSSTHMAQWSEDPTPACSLTFVNQRPYKGSGAVLQRIINDPALVDITVLYSNTMGVQTQGLLEDCRPCIHNGGQKIKVIQSHGRDSGQGSYCRGYCRCVKGKE